MLKVRIGINLVQLNSGKSGGVEQFIKNLIEHTVKFTDDNLYLFLNKNSRKSFNLNCTLVKKIFININGDPYKLDNQFHSLIKTFKIDIWVCPLFYLQPIGLKIPSVVLIPDIQHEIFPEFFSINELKWRKYSIKNSVKSADLIFTISNFSKNSIIRQYEVPENKIHTIYGDSPIEFLNFQEGLKEKIKNKYNLPNSFGLYPANTWPHKNHLNLLKSLVILRDKYNEKVNIIFTGYKLAHIENYKSIKKYIKENNLQKEVRFIGYIPQEDMKYLYLNSKFLIYPSLFEGFGIPLVESMRTRIPIVCSNAGSIPEIVGDAGLFFNPNNPEEIALKLFKVFDEKTRSSLIEKGNHRVKQFSWEESAKKLVHHLHKLVKVSP